ncbi:hypothetical protein LPJ66_008223 [Kickxella alabastrina]|uniref:Uncharacterized protein n=1 Tax=Kickxella alabastrina TaxID=61397 RepID=A0ACC1I962_9FUNG|nr:hypothetical protein LPJ66_008223 [Kickxella alabastrina]
MQSAALKQLGHSSLAGKTALVTGASGGIGRAISFELARRGARIVATGRSRSKLHALRETLNGEQTLAAAEHISIECDVRNKDSVRDLCAQSGSVDILVNAAGVSRDGLLVRQRIQDIEEMLETNLLGTMALCRVVATGMMRRRAGVIINVSSVVGMRGNVGQSAYAATKAGVIGFSKALAKELGPRGIRCNVLAPGFIETELTRDILQNPVTKALIEGVPLGRVGLVDEVAHAAAFLAEAEYMTGQVRVYVAIVIVIASHM